MFKYSPKALPQRPTWEKDRGGEQQAPPSAAPPAAAGKRRRAAPGSAVTPCPQKGWAAGGGAEARRKKGKAKESGTNPWHYWHAAGALKCTLFSSFLPLVASPALRPVLFFFFPRQAASSRKRPAGFLPGRCCFSCRRLRICVVALN